MWKWSISLPAVDISTEVHLKLNSQKSLQGVAVKDIFINLKVLMIQFMLLAKIHLSTYSHWSVASKLIYTDSDGHTDNIFYLVTSNYRNYHI